MVYTKICGISDVSILQACVKDGADAVGFVVGVPESPRNLSERQALDLIHQTPPHVHTVVVTGIFALNEVDYLARRFPKSRIQVHFRCRHPRFEDLCTLNLERIIPAMTADQVLAINLNFPAIQKVFDQIPYILLDGSMGKGSLEKTELSMKAIQILRPCKVVLGGGLAPANLLAILQKVHPYGVDVSSGVEKAPGIKDIEKLKAFLSIAKNFDGKKVPPIENYAQKPNLIQTELKKND
jgi:phosphoribosylanthranilate isomerase